MRIRIGIHTGEPALTDEGYVGIDVHRAARIGAAAHGGQILLSQQTRDLAGGGGLVELGDHRLKDVGVLRLYQVGDREFPPVRSIGATNLSAEAELLGRDASVVSSSACCERGRRLVTITGPGGIGKTTLARAAASALAGRLGGRRLVRRSRPAGRPGQVERQVAAALGAPAAVIDYLRSRRLLLVLDNFEQRAGRGRRRWRSGWRPARRFRCWSPAGERAAAARRGRVPAGAAATRRRRRAVPAGAPVP